MHSDTAWMFRSANPYLRQASAVTAKKRALAWAVPIGGRTCGCRALGEAHARLFVEEGGKVAVTDLNVERGQALADELGENAAFFRHDVTSLDDWKRVLDETERAFGAVSVLVNNAGIIGPLAPTAELDETDYLRVVA